MAIIDNAFKRFFKGYDSFLNYLTFKYTLLFDTRLHWDKVVTFHEKCDWKWNVFVLIKTKGWQYLWGFTKVGFGAWFNLYKACVKHECAHYKQALK